MLVFLVIILSATLTPSFTPILATALFHLYLLSQQTRRTYYYVPGPVQHYIFLGKVHPTVSVQKHGRTMEGHGRSVSHCTIPNSNSCVEEQCRCSVLVQWFRDHQVVPETLLLFNIKQSLSKPRCTGCWVGLASSISTFYFHSDLPGFLCDLTAGINCTYWT